MCKNNSTRPLWINSEIVYIDECIHKLIWCLNRNGMETVASCCGHGKQPGRILLKDGREIIISDP